MSGFHWPPVRPALILMRPNCRLVRAQFVELAQLGAAAISRSRPASRVGGLSGPGAKSMPLCSSITATFAGRASRVQLAAAKTRLSAGSRLSALGSRAADPVRGDARKYLSSRRLAMDCNMAARVGSGAATIQFIRNRQLEFEPQLRSFEASNCSSEFRVAKVPSSESRARVQSGKLDGLN